MKRITLRTGAPIFAAALLFALPAGAEEPTPPPSPSQASPTNAGVVAPAPIPAASTTTTTSADTPTASDATAGPTTSEVRSTDTVTVNRSIRPNRPWLITGGAVLLGSYITTAAITSSSGRDVEDRNLLIPVVGPWLNLSDRRCDGCADETRNVALVIGSGVAQGIGAGMAIASFFIPEKVAAATIQAGPLKLHVMPTSVGRGGMGLGSLGTF